ncbi:phage portal protein [Paraburkholderia sp. MM6662-R1]|uniref:phage portal protein n=1 Tax=Paraburkholderia sp. MM6662-R1 TaxID=2991066 RepID=UPI003D1BCF50
MPDKATSAAFDPAAPADERVDALAGLQREHMPTASDLLPPEHVRSIIDEAMHQFSSEPLVKAVADNVVPFPSLAAREHKRGMQSVILDENKINVQGEFWERPSVLSYDSLRMMVSQTPILNGVIMTRIRQVQRFCRIAEKGNEVPGFEIRHVDRAHQLTRSETESIGLLNRFIMNNGWQFRPRLRKSLHRDSFSQFMAKSVRDALTMDSAPIETEWKRNRALGIDGFYAVDGATIRLCTEQGYRGDDEIFALQVVEGAIRAAYTHNDLIYEPRNPRTDVNGAGYGVSETELLVRVVTGYLNAMTYNIKGFDSNSIPKGMLHLTGNYDDNDIRAFRRYWNALVQGINNSWALPVMVSKDQESKAAFERFGVEFNEMYFAKWMTFLTSIICALYGMSPSEINFDSFSGSNTSPLAGSDTGEKLAASKDSGLRPLLAQYENLISDFIIGEYSEDLVFRWTGLDPEDAQNKQEMRKLMLSWNEIRAEEGKKAVKGPLGDAPVANPAALQAWLQFNPPPQPEGQEGAEGEEGGDNKGIPGADADAANDPDAPDAPDADDTETTDDAPDETAGEPDFGEPPAADFGKAFGLPPVYSLEDLT